VIAESIAGDTAVGHALAYCMAMEGLAGASPPIAAASLRGIALELERLANHVGDLGALCGDVAYLPGASYFGRLRGNFLNLLMELAGNRYGRGLLSVGGVRFGLDSSMRKTFLERLAKDETALRTVADLMFDTPSVLSRFEGTGIVSVEQARDLGLVGPVARASGVSRDVRHDHPTGMFRFAHIPLTMAKTGDVMARALVRRLEMQRSLTFVQEQLRELPDGPLTTKVEPAEPNRMVVALVEGWRGEIAHVAVTDHRGQLRGYKIVDPSFHNWFGLSVALRGNQISDFPLCNKSFNLSYAGHDL
jgi:Ni,Fe-hydrogenase III large subunit